MPNTYSAGNLELDILSFSEKSISSIDLAAKSLSRLALSIDKVNNAQFVFAGQKLEYIFERIAKSTKSIDTKNLENLSVAAKSLSSISKIGNLDKVDYNKVAQGFSQLSTSVRPFLNELKGSEESLSALNRLLKTQNTSKPKAENNSRFNFLNVAKWSVILHSARRLGNYMGSIVQAGSDYMETLNLWQVAMGKNIDLADKFVNKINRAYGISTRTVMNAQAIFKNMIGSLGQISDETAYKLSEALVQMSADFASLYNVSVKSAFEKMQSMLAGQVRPIRSAGLDITETTLYQFYQELGGEKSMRQLNRTEKQLLSILAVFKQMESAGALGDMSKTLNMFANQSRMMAENFQEVKTWSGLLLKDLIDDTGALVYINAFLITTAEILKAIAKSRDADKDESLMGLIFGTEEDAEKTEKSIDKLQGRLLDIDKFRTLNKSGGSALAIDEKLLEAITGYESKLKEAKNEASKLADEWLAILGFTRDENGELVSVENSLTKYEFLTKAIAVTIGGIMSLGLFAGIVKLGTGIYSYGVKPLLSLIKVLGKFASVIGKTVTTYIFSFIKVIGKFAFAAGKTAVTAVISFIKVLYTMNTIAFGSSAKAIFSMTVGFIGLTAAIAGAVLLISNWGDMSNWQRIIAIVGVATTAILGLAMAFGLFQSAWSMGLATAGIIAGFGAVIGSIASAKKEIATPVYAANGASNIDSGTLFVAGKMGRTEAVYSGSNGKTNVANVQQMEQAFFNALQRNNRSSGGRVVAEVYLDGEKIYQNTTQHAKSKGLNWSKKQ